MNKIDYKDKLDMYQKYKQGKSIRSIAKEYNISLVNLNYMIRIIELHGTDILRKNKNQVYPLWLKKELVKKALNKEDSIFNIAANAGLVSRTLLHGWISKYIKNGYNIVERKRGSPTIMEKPKGHKKEETQEEKIERLEKENLYLKAELEYSKKLRAVVQARKNRQQKKK